MTLDGPLAVFSALINRNIAQSSTAKRELAALDGQSLCVTVEGIGITLYLVAADAELSVSRDPMEAPTATIAGAPLSLLGLLREKQIDAQSLRQRGIRLAGDEAVAAGFARLLERARPELEEDLSAVIGDVAAHQVGNGLRALEEFGQRTGNAIQKNTSEYLQEELRVAPVPLEVRAFLNDVDRLRDDVERAAARLKRFQRRGSGVDT